MSKTNSSGYVAHRWPMIDNYVYLYHTDTLIIVPEYADSVTDTLQVNFSPTTILTRTAPIYSYSDSGPRQINVAFQLHRDMLKELNYSNTKLKKNLINDDYVETFIRQIQAAALPAYSTATKMVNPPMVAVRLSSDIFIKGVVSGSVGVTYKGPIIPGIDSDGNKDDTLSRYACVDVSFNVVEVDPYDADTVMKTGSFRGLNTSLENRIYTLAGGNNSGGGTGNGTPYKSGGTGNQLNVRYI